MQRVLLEVVADKTGYPAEMLNLDMGLDADLGIDSIKRVEILSALQEKLPDAPAVKPEHLGTLNTLEQIVAFLAAGTTAVAQAVPVGGERDKVRQVLLEVVSEKTGYPAEMLNLDMGLDADLGIDSIKRVEILSALQERLPGAPAVKPEHLGTLNTLDQIVAFLANGTAPIAPVEPVGVSGISRQTLRSAPIPFERDRPAIALPPGAAVVLVAGADALADHLAEQVRARGCNVVRHYWDSPIETPAEAAGLVLLAPLQATQDTLATAFRWLRACSASLQKSGKAGGALFATVSRLDGEFGLEHFDAESIPFAGGFAGLSKTAHHEWPAVSSKAIDLDPRSGDPAGIATALADELFRMGPVEVGITSKGRVTLQLADAATPAVDPTLLGSSDVILISGGARGVTAECALALAEQYRPTLVLLGRSPLPGEEPEWLTELTDEREIKRALGARANGAGSPREINRRYQDLAAAREVRVNLARIAATGARVVYRSVDVRDAENVAAVVAQLRQELGPITGIVHGAGVIEDRRIADKTDEQFDRVVGTKVEGLLNLLAATEGEPLKVLALFSSSTGRFGRSGQVDYAVANEVLNKIARREAARRPECRVVAVNWGPWEGGMVTPELRGVFGAEGVGLIPMREGARFLLAELSDAARPVEVVACVWLDKKDEAPAIESEPPISVSDLDPIFEREVDVTSHPILASHVIGERAVLPLALHVEWLVHAALHGNPGYVFHGLNDVRVFNGVKIRPDEKVRVQVLAGKTRKQHGGFVAPVELRGQRGDGRSIIYSRGEVVLVNALAAEEPRLSAGGMGPYPLMIEDAYERILFHGPDLRGIVRIEGISVNGIAAMVRTAPPPAEWMRQPLRQNWLAEPLALDAAFQLLILWGVEKRGIPNLPAGFAKYRQFRRSFPAGELRVMARIAPSAGPIIRADVEWIDADGALVARLEGGEFVGDANLAAAFRRNRLALASA